MSKWYQKGYINRRNWLIENVGKLKLSSDQFLIVMIIDYLNDQSEVFNLDTISKISGLDLTSLDKIIAELGTKGYLKIDIKNNTFNFNLDGIFQEEKIIPESLPILSQFEKEFGRTLSNNEIEKLVEWSEKYNEDELLDGLREASIYRKLNMKYIEKVLKDKNES